MPKSPQTMKKQKKSGAADASSLSVGFLAFFVFSILRCFYSANFISFSVLSAFSSSRMLLVTRNHFDMFTLIIFIFFLSATTVGF
jgi:hypothetical protein